MYPMESEEFEKWLAILREHFPDNGMLPEFGTNWYPGKPRR